MNTTQPDTFVFATGSISAAHYYSSLELKELLGVGDWTLNKWKDNGLGYTKVGHDYLFQGIDVINYLQNHKTYKTKDQ